jgi:hypothetical protein
MPVPPPLTIARFWSKVDVRQSKKECWEWRGKLGREGYGFFNWGKYPDTHSGKSHRVAYAIFYGQIEAGLVVDHLCRNPACCNPFHLEAVTHGVNIKRGYESRAKGL